MSILRWSLSGVVLRLVFGEKSRCTVAPGVAEVLTVIDASPGSQIADAT
jgi:hypothetical protein